MKSSEIELTLENIKNTLEAIEIKGKKNMSHLLGCIYLLEQTIPAVHTLVASTTKGDESNEKAPEVE